MIDWRFLNWKPAHPTLTRIDVIINYIDTLGTFGTRIIHGVPSPLPAPPAIELFNCLAWVPMYKVRILPASTSIIASRDIEVYR